MYDRLKENGFDYPLWYVGEVIELFCDYDLIRDYEKFKNKGRYRPKPVIAIDEDGNETVYKTTKEASRATGINCGLISMCCKGGNYVRRGYSKKDGKNIILNIKQQNLWNGIESN